jgi:SRSO17 transposase
VGGVFGAADDLDAWLAPFLGVLGRRTRRAWAPLYLRGLLGPGERKSLRPTAARLGLPGHDQLHHFIASPAWDDGPLWTALAETADRLAGGPEAVPAIDDTALPKKGELSVGVARQYCGRLGRKANCQALVSLTLARGEVPAPVALRLFLPEEWTSDPDRCARAGVPAAAMVARSKGAIALAELGRLRAAGLRFGIVASGSCWRMPGTAWAPRSATGSTRGTGSGRWASRAPRRSTPPPCGCTGRGRGRGGRARRPRRARSRGRRRACWPGRGGAA